ncbi:hypothetical protein [Ruegeria sp. HKCCA4812]|uniref:hypothetical protein n=1 Tax=Ruegeria sp. HKCCA4812 TaxID=2682993 RepID=UPI0014881A0C|nr:hypothetical protein [Ruegeria sp. HKCCA4812]
MTNETTAPEREDDYWIVSLEAFAFDTAEDAKLYADRLADAFTAMPESDGYGASVKYYHASDDALEAAQARIAELEGALGPFAEAASVFDKDYPGLMKPGTSCGIRFGALTKARAALEGKG